jgi:ferrous iron transport protein B
MGVAMSKVLLVGNPNCGKTTLFNSLTGDTQRIGNWSGVTVEKKTGFRKVDGKDIQITDLPGVYSLCVTKNSAEDCKITASAVVSDDFDIIINVIDACHLERHLYLTTQLLELNKPMIVVMNMMDIAKNRKITIDTKLLAQQLQCPVISMQAHKGLGVLELEQNILNYQTSQDGFSLLYPDFIQENISQIKQKLIADFPNLKEFASYHAQRLLEGSSDFGISAKEYNIADDTDILMADFRYEAVHNIVLKVQSKASDLRENLTAKIDKIILHRFFALPIFISVMYVMFLLAINIGSAFQDFFDITTSAIFVGGTTKLLGLLSAPNWLVTLVANGIGRGINTTATFIPVIALMFFLLSLLETSGYMARAAFVIDRIMRMLGLPGKAFVPMIVGFGCNVPGIMAARTLDSERDRVLTVLMSPFMSCSARLAIYAVFVTAFFPHGGQNIVFTLYVIGILMAVFTGLILRKTILNNQTSPLIIELPAYHRPSLKRLLKETTSRLRHFLIRAGKLIIPVCVVLSCLNSWIVNTSSGEMSVLALFGQWLTPVFSPMGIEQDNWPAVVGLITGALAKEVVIGSLNSLYANIGHISQLSLTTDFSFLNEMQLAFSTLRDNLAKLGDALVSPIFHNTDAASMSDTAFGVMYQQFNTKAAAFAYLLFILLYIPCVSTMAAIRQETNSKLMWFSIIWSLLIAYTSAVTFYQIATFATHIQQSITWLVGLILVVISAILVMKLMSIRRGTYVATTS